MKTALLFDNSYKTNQKRAKICVQKRIKPYQLRVRAGLHHARTEVTLVEWVRRR